MSSLTELVADMPVMPGVGIPPAAAIPVVGPAEDGRLDFASLGGAEIKEPVGRQLIEPVHAGGIDGVTRWHRFNEVYGSFLHAVRKGQLTPEDADARCRGWIQVNMIPPWSEDKIVTEMRGLRAADERKYGPLVNLVQPPLAPAQDQQSEIVLENWRADRAYLGNPKPVTFLAKFLLEAGGSHLLAAEDGAGKSSLALQILIALLSFRADQPAPEVLGYEVTSAAEGCSVVFLTAEDSKEEILRRLRAICPDAAVFDRIKARLYILPFVDEGGVFSFLEKDMRSGTAVRSKRWAALASQLKTVPNLALVVVGTLSSTLHGEDTRMDVTQEYCRDLTGLVCGEIKAALLVTHHVRKTASGAIQSNRDMKQATRGSGVLTASFRCVWNMWEPDDWKRRMNALGETPEEGMLYLFAVTKANNFKKSSRFILRLPDRTFRDVTEDAEVADGGEAEAWLVCAVGLAAAAGHPFSKTSVNDGLYARREQLPPILQSFSRDAFRELADRALKRKVIVQARLEKQSKAMVLDIPDGPVAQGRGSRKGGKWQVDWNEYEYLEAVQKVVDRRTLESVEESSE
jgi:hypothetical protein